MDLSAHIRDLITVANELKKAIGVDKKALNKTIARLEEAELWATRINTGRVDGAAAGRDECTCSPGVRDGGCPVHGRAL